MLPLAISSLIILLDQLTKLLVRRIFDLGECLQVIPGVFNLCHVQNTGAAWGMLAGQRIALLAFSIVMCAAMVFFREKVFGKSLVGRICLGLLCGGIIGNLIDRACLGYVVDFLDFHWGTSHFPAFNVADSAICVGAFLFIVASWISDIKAGKAKGTEAGQPADGASDKGE